MFLTFRFFIWYWITT